MMDMLYDPRRNEPSDNFWEKRAREYFIHSWAHVPASRMRAHQLESLSSGSASSALSGAHSSIWRCRCFSPFCITSARIRTSWASAPEEGSDDRRRKKGSGGSSSNEESVSDGPGAGLQNWPSHFGSAGPNQETPSEAPFFASRHALVDHLHQRALGQSHLPKERQVWDNFTGEIWADAVGVALGGCGYLAGLTVCRFLVVLSSFSLSATIVASIDAGPLARGYGKFRGSIKRRFSGRFDWRLLFASASLCMAWITREASLGPNLRRCG